MAVNQWCVKGSTVTIGADSGVEGKIVSEISVSGGETEKTVIAAMDGSNFTCLGTQSDFEMAFDFIPTTSALNGAEYIYGAGSTDGDVTTWTFANDGSTSSDITIALGNNAAGHSLTYVFSGCLGVSGIPKFAFGGANVLSLTFTCNPDNVSMAIDTTPA